jgi:sterol desaturase/sphingolipid hydroxylase (fatty acid hydroxylase superfamily)/CDGSH-type Zn-finger protein
MKNGVGFDVYLVLGILIFFALMEIVVGRLKNSKRTFNDWIQEAGGFFVLSLLIKPAIVISMIGLGSYLFPQAQNIISGMSLWIVFPLYMFIDDLMQYWYHRSGHEYEFLWKLHRSHHQAEEMGFFIAYRNAALYYLMMPNLWYLALVTYLGGGYAVAIGLVAKQLIIIGSHSTLMWDKPLYKHKFTSVLMRVIERIIVTPAFHHGHHGKSKLDGISDPNGNFGNMFSIWDQLFGSAVFSRKFPSEYGLQTDLKENWSASYLYPLIKSKDENSLLSKGYKKVDTSFLEPAMVELKQGKSYLWCQCGKSKNQPFCDGSHHGSKIKPLLFKAKRDGKARLCNCKQSKTKPFCDNTHLELMKDK